MNSIIIKYIGLIPFFIYFSVLYYKTKELNYFYMQIFCFIYVAIISIIDITKGKSDYSQNIDKNFNRMEIDELTRTIELKEQMIIDKNRVIEEIESKMKHVKSLYEEITNGYIDTIMVFSDFFENKGTLEFGNCRRVMEIAIDIGKRMELRDDEIEILKYSAVLHDIGKIGIPEGIVNKAEKLDKNETNILMKHPIVAYDILEGVGFLKNSSSVILQHHERFDGKGYPYGIEGNKINKLARILGVADAFEAMLTDRPYKKGMTLEEAKNEIIINKGTQFDPEIADVLIAMINETKEDEKYEKESKKDN